MTGILFHGTLVALFVVVSLRWLALRGGAITGTVLVNGIPGMGVNGT